MDVVRTLQPCRFACWMMEFPGIPKYAAQNVLEKMVHNCEQVINLVLAMDRRRQSLFVLGCAERLAPVFRFLASENSVQTYDDVREMVWKKIATSEVIAAARQGRDIISVLPESSETDSHLPSYYAMLSLSVLAYALQVLAGDDVENGIVWACTAALDVCACLDALGAKDASGGVEAVEIIEQDAICQELLKVRGVDRAFVDHVRLMCQSEWGVLHEALRQVSKRQEWSIGFSD